MNKAHLVCLPAILICGCESVGNFGRPSDLLPSEAHSDAAIRRSTLYWAGSSTENPDEITEQTFEKLMAKQFLPDEKTDLKYRRDLVQDHLIKLSNDACSAFKDKIYFQQASANISLGTVATGLASAGAIVTDVNLTRAFSGAAAAVLGVRGEINENLFREKVAEVIGRGIEKRRTRILMEIATANKLSYKEYTVQRAIADAVRYNSACSLIEGLEEIGESLGEANRLVAEDAGVSFLNGPEVRFEPTSPQISTANAAAGSTLGTFKVVGLGGFGVYTFKLFDADLNKVELDTNSGDIKLRVAVVEPEVISFGVEATQVGADGTSRVISGKFNIPIAGQE